MDNSWLVCCWRQRQPMKPQLYPWPLSGMFNTGGKERGGPQWSHSGGQVIITCWDIDTNYTPVYRAPFLSLGALGATLSSFYLLVELGLLLFPFPAFIWWELYQLCLKGNQHICLKWTKLFSGPIYTCLEVFSVFLAKTKLKADTQLTAVMCCQISDMKSVAPSSGDFWRWPAPR